jgi:hypothetical protein
VRTVLSGGDIGPLREFLRRADKKCAHVEDVLAAAAQTVIDEVDAVTRISLHEVVRRVAQIERDALASLGRDALAPLGLRDLQGNFRTVYAS